MSTEKAPDFAGIAKRLAEEDTSKAREEFKDDGAMLFHTGLFSSGIRQQG